MSLYDLDFHAWATQQARLARRRSGNELDWDNVAEELEGLGKQQRSELKSRYLVLLTHLLKDMFSRSDEAGAGSPRSPTNATRSPSTWPPTQA
jgi:hypothetical protein